eukprot:3933904-Rhodomonas_salina.3
MVRPPSLVQHTMQAVCALLGEHDDWPTAQKVLRCLSLRPTCACANCPCPPLCYCRLVHLSVTAGLFQLSGTAGVGRPGLTCSVDLPSVDLSAGLRDYWLLALPGDGVGRLFRAP